MASPTRVLFVDDEPTIRVTLPKILEMHEFEVKAAASVQDALRLIQEEKFDVLLSDLNIGAPSDGFTVVSAMRCVQPDAVTIIITGYPAFESALQAIREQVDDYISKPADVDDLVNTIKQKVKHGVRQTLQPQKFTCDSLESHKQQILQAYVNGVRGSELPARNLSDDDVRDHVPLLIDHLIEDLRKPSHMRETKATEVSAQHGRTRRKQGFAVADLVEEIRLLRNVVYGTIQRSLLELNTSSLVPDMVRVGDYLLLRLRESVDAYLEDATAKKPAKSTTIRKSATMRKPAKAAKVKRRVRRAS
jgi:YesN/AraC family two-component response regulator